MLDKDSKKVLKYIKNLYTVFGNAMNNAIDGRITLLEHQDAAALNIPSHKLFLICKELEKYGYLENVTYSDCDVTVSITQQGLSYSKYVLYQSLKYWIPIVTSNLIALIALLHSVFTD